MQGFDNDCALDWLVDLQAADDWSVVERALRDAAECDPAACLDYERGQSAFAAATVVVAADNPSTITIPDEVVAWIIGHRHAPSEIRALARAALRRVVAGNSEVETLWLEADQSDQVEWRANIDRLVTLLG